MVKIYLYGELGNQFGREYNLEVASPNEAVRALIYTKPGFIDAFQQYDYQIAVGSLDDCLEEDQLDLKTNRDIHIIPYIQGSKKGVGKIIAAVVIIAAAVYYGASTGDIGGATAIANIGISIGLRGISMLLSKQPEEADNKLFNNDAQTAQQNNPIPLLYGEMYFDLVPVSASITTGLAPSYGSLDFDQSAEGSYSWNPSWTFYRNVTEAQKND